MIVYVTFAESLLSAGSISHTARACVRERGKHLKLTIFPAQRERFSYENQDTLTVSLPTKTYKHFSHINLVELKLSIRHDVAVPRRRPLRLKENAVISIFNVQKHAKSGRVSSDVSF